MSPEAKVKKKEYDKLRRQRPDVLAREKERRQTAEFKEQKAARMKVYRQTEHAKSVVRTAMTKYRETEKGRLKGINWYRRTHYNLNQEQLEYVNKQGTCECCGAVFDKSVNKHIDHCHKTGRFRGVLCRGCNSAEGFLRGDPIRAIRLFEYMLRVRHF